MQFSKRQFLLIVVLIFPLLGIKPVWGDGDLMKRIDMYKKHMWDFCRLDFFIPEDFGAVIPVGCEVIDCCPGCPGAVRESIDWRINLISEPIEAVNLNFDNLSPETADKLTIKGNAKWIDKDTLRIGRGEIILEGFNVDPRARPPVAIPDFIVDETKKKKFLESLNTDADKEKEGIVLVIEQLRENVIVNEFVLQLRIRDFRWCYKEPTPGPSEDKIDLNDNAASDSAVVLLDGRRSTDCVDDERWRGDDIIGVDNVLTRGSCNSEVIVFSDDDAMQLVENVATWTDNTGDKLDVSLNPNLLQTPLTVWVMQGTFANTSGRVNTDMNRANQLYNIMNCGISFQATINNATANANTAGLLNANCGQAANLRNQIGFTNNRLNAYYLNNPGARGWWCGNNTIIIGATADNESLAHEIGHAFTLGHTNTLAGMTATNLMVTGGTGRNNITEGQCFRSNVNTDSRLNGNGIRTGPTRNCPDGTTSSTCPALSLDVNPN